MNDYDKTIVQDGKTYRYDPDYDCYYRVYAREELTHWNTYGWIYVTAILTVITFCVTYL